MSSSHWSTIELRQRSRAGGSHASGRDLETSVDDPSLAEDPPAPDHVAAQAGDA
jgi:hypothetical protein